jgi:uncharacterized protein (TIGR02266 family)
MEPISSFLTVSISIGGAVFVCLVVFWFLAVYLKRRVTGSSAPTSPAAPASGNGSWDEKRAHPRLAISWPASLQALPGNARCQVKDISRGGAFVACAQPLELGSHFRITIAPPGANPIELNAEVVWSNQNVPAEQVVTRGMGVRFINNDETQRRQLSEAIAGLLRAAEPA